MPRLSHVKLILDYIFGALQSTEIVYNIVGLVTTLDTKV